MAAVEPREQVGRDERREPLLVPGDLTGVERVEPSTGDPFPEEAAPVADHALTIRHRVLGPCPHRREPGRRRPARARRRRRSCTRAGRREHASTPPGRPAGRRSGPAPRSARPAATTRPARCHATPGSTSRCSRGSRSISIQASNESWSDGQGALGSGGAFPVSSAHRTRSMFSCWWYSDTAASSGWRATTTYVARGSSGMPSSGVWVLTKRRWVCASSRARTSSIGRVVQSSHGDRSAIGAGSSGVPKIRSAQIICVHVVPCLVRVLITMSPSRKANPSHRPLSSSDERYRNGATTTTERTDARTKSGARWSWWRSRSDPEVADTEPQRDRAAVPPGAERLGANLVDFAPRGGVSWLCRAPQLGQGRGVRPLVGQTVERSPPSFASAATLTANANPGDTIENPIPYDGNQHRDAHVGTPLRCGRPPTAGR